MTKKGGMVIGSFRKRGTKTFSYKMSQQMLNYLKQEDILTPLQLKLVYYLTNNKIFYKQSNL